VIDEHHAVVRLWNGRIVKQLGDDLLRTFPDPAAGVHAALGPLGTAPVPLRRGAGVHTGDAVSTRKRRRRPPRQRRGRALRGGKGGQVLVSEDVRVAAGEPDDVRFGRTRARRMKGVQQRVRVCGAAPLPVSPAPTTP
jgi:class 3 adenylate cyclase